MAPAKSVSSTVVEKEAKLTPEQSASLVMEYLRKQNRPYSAIDISANLKNRVTKTATAKLLKELHERGEIEGRTAGKAIVYHCLQDESGAASAEQLQTTDAAISRLRDEMADLKADEKELRVALREASARVPLSELRAAITVLSSKKTEVEGHLAVLKAGNAKTVSLSEREAILKDYRMWQKAAAARKKIRAEMWSEVAAAVGKEKVMETKEELGLQF